MITKYKIKYRKTFVFNERGNTNPDAFIFINAYNILEARDMIKRATNQSVVLVDYYPLRKKNHKRYTVVPDWAV